MHAVDMHKVSRKTAAIKPLIKPLMLMWNCNIRFYRPLSLGERKPVLMQQQTGAAGLNMSANMSKKRGRLDDVKYIF